MTEKEEKIFQTFAEVIPKLSDSDKSYLLGLGEGISVKIKMAEELKIKEMKQDAMAV